MTRSIWALGLKQVRSVSIFAAAVVGLLVILATSFGMSYGDDAATNASWLTHGSMPGTVGSGEVEQARVDTSLISESVPLPLIKPAEDPAFLAALWFLAAIVIVVGIASIVKDHRKLQASIRELGEEIDAMAARAQARKAERRGSLVMSNTPNLVRNKLPSNDSTGNSRAERMDQRTNEEVLEFGSQGNRDFSAGDDIK